MSESDSGVDTGSESNESNCMSVESPSRLDEEKDLVDITERIPIPGVSHQPQLHHQHHHIVSNVNPFISFQPAYCSYGYTDYRQQEHTSKIKPSLLKRNNNKWKTTVYLKNFDIIGERKLRKAVISNSIEQAQNLLENGVDSCSSDEKQRTPLHFAACHGHSEMARLLIEHGADTNQKDVLGNTPLHLAACTSHIEMVTLLLKAGTDVNAFNNSGRSPLHLAQSKLKLLQMNKSFSSMQLKTEIMHVLEMMQVYLQRSGQIVEIDLINVFSNRLHHHQTREEVNSDVNDLLSSLSHLSLHKP